MSHFTACDCGAVGSGPDWPRGVSGYGQSGHWPLTVSVVSIAGADPEPIVGGLSILDRGDVEFGYESKRGGKGVLHGNFFKSGCSQKAASPIIIWNPHQKASVSVTPNTRKAKVFN